jgi:hypothetical protein
MIKKREDRIGEPYMRLSWKNLMTERRITRKLYFVTFKISTEGHHILSAT